MASVTIKRCTHDNEYIPHAQTLAMTLTLHDPAVGIYQAFMQYSTLHSFICSWCSSVYARGIPGGVWIWSADRL